MDVEVGTVWRERDNRFVRYVIVIGLDGEKALIQQCDETGKDRFTSITKASIRRFNGKSGGYAPVESVPAKRRKR